MIINSRWDCPKCYTRLPKKEYENTPERFCPKCGKDIYPPVRPDSGPRGRVRAVTDDYWGVIVVALIVIVCLVGWFDIYDKVREFEYEDLKPIWQSGFVQFLAHIFLWPFLINSDIWVNNTMYLGKGEANPELASPGYWAYLWRMVLTNTNCILVGVFILGIGSFIAGIVADSASRVKRMFGKKKTNNL